MTGARMAKSHGYKGRRVRCAETGEYGSSLAFFKAPDGHYYKDEGTYKSHTKRVETRKELMDVIAHHLGYTPGMVFPTIVTKYLKDLSFYGDDVILETFKRYYGDVDLAMRTKKFDSDQQRSAYMMGIIRGHINDVYKDIERMKGAQERRPTQEVVSPSDIASIGTSPHKHKDISSFLDDE